MSLGPSFSKSRYAWCLSLDVELPGFTAFVLVQCAVLPVQVPDPLLHQQYPLAQYVHDAAGIQPEHIACGYVFEPELVGQLLGVYLVGLDAGLRHLEPVRVCQRDGYAAPLKLPVRLDPHLDRGLAGCDAVVFGQAVDEHVHVLSGVGAFGSLQHAAVRIHDAGRRRSVFRCLFLRLLLLFPFFLTSFFFGLASSKAAITYQG